MNLIVPINVEALCINERAETQTFVGAANDFSNLPAWDAQKGMMGGLPYLSASLQHFAQRSLQLGIHLHWALPDALTHGTRGSDGKIAFPPVPNRWLVTRIHGDSVRSWIVESDFVSMAGDGVSIPYEDPKADQYFRRLGRFKLYEEWQEEPGHSFKDIAKQPLTAVGYGEAGFAAFYPSCRSVFGFHDDSPDGSARLTYVVSGWFADAADDPVPSSGSTNPQEWAFSGSEIPSRTIYSGTIVGIVWNRETDYFARQKNPIQVVIGNNNLECVSALIGSRPEIAADTDAELLLDAVQMGLLTTRQTGWLATLDAALHRESFGSVPGGSIWVIKHAPQPGAGPANTDPEQTWPALIADALNTLNSLQQQYDELQQEIDSLRERIFHDWYRYALIRHEPSHSALDEIVPGLDNRETFDAFADSIRALLDDEAGKLAELQAGCGALVIERRDDDDDAGSPSAPGTLAGQIAQKMSALKQQLRTIDARLRVQVAPAPRFWEPSEPVVLLAGPDVQPPLRHGQDDIYRDDGYLPCRLSGELLTRLDAGSNTLAAAELLHVPALEKAAGLGADLAALVAEAALLDEDRAAAIASVLSVSAEEVRAWQSTQGPGALSSLGKGPCPLALTRWRDTPWIPIFMSWKVSYHPLDFVGPAGADRFAPDAVTAHQRLDDDEVDLAHSGPAPSRAQSYEGTIPLTAYAMVKLKDQLDQYLTAAGDAELQDIAKKLGDTPMLSQALSGFNRALLMTNSALQMKVLDPLAGDDPLVAKISAAVGARSDNAPRPFDAFNPIRAGFLKLTQLELIDAFGQVHDVDVSHPLCSARLTPLDEQARAAGFASLPPRIVQPSRLQFRWLSAEDDQVEMNSHPATSPVFGWLVPSYLSGELLIYDASGAALGSLQSIGGGSRLRWQPAPVNGKPLETARDRAEQEATISADIENPHLRLFVLGILRNAEGPAFLLNLMRAIDVSLATIMPDRAHLDVSVSVLMGKPLALVRASLQLDLHGLPAGSQSWQSFQSNLRGGTESDSRGFLQIGIGVRLGDLHHVDDGLVGYFRESLADPTDYQRFYSPAAGGAGGVMLPSQNPIVLTCDPAAGAQLFSLLIDPHAAVHATSGVLPVKDISIPPDQYASALKQIQLSFQVNPVLVGADARQLPLRPLEGFGWSWLEVRGDSWVEEKLAPATDRALTTYSPQLIDEGWLTLAPRK